MATKKTPPPKKKTVPPKRDPKTLPKGSGLFDRAGTQIGNRGRDIDKLVDDMS